MGRVAGSAAGGIQAAGRVRAAAGRDRAAQQAGGRQGAGGSVWDLAGRAVAVGPPGPLDGAASRLEVGCPPYFCSRLRCKAP